ncbi:MAG: tetratricopeptide repeat protein, partial [bacterium]
KTDGDTILYENQIYCYDPNLPTSWYSLHPFIYSSEADDDIFIYNQFAGEGRAEFISYCSGANKFLDYKSCEELFSLGETQKAPQKILIPIKVSDRNIVHNLPQPDWYFFVERPELEKDAVAKLNHPRMYITTFDGIGGCGKTALALKIAYDLLSPPENQEPQFEYVVWVTAKSTRLDPDGIKIIDQQLTSLADLLKEILRVVGFEDLVQTSDEDILKSHVFDTLSMAKFLIIIDNLETVEDSTRIWDFLVDPRFVYPSKVIVTSRHRQKSGELVVNVRGMTKDQVKGLINSEVQRIGIENFSPISKTLLDVLISKTAGIPIAIKQVIAHVSGGISLRRAIERLPDRPDDVLDFCYPESFKLLENNDRTLFFALAKAVEPAGIAELKFITSLSEYDLDKSIVNLDKLSLVEINSAGEQGDLYHLLPLTQKFALRELRNYPELENELLSKLADLEQLRQMAPTFGDLPSMAGIATSERMLQLALVSAARTLHDKADFWFKKALEVDKDNAQIWLAKAKYEYRDKQDLDSARKAFLKASELSENEEPLVAWGHVERAEKNWDKAIDLFSKAIDLNKNNKYSYHGLGLTLYEKGVELKGFGKKRSDRRAIGNGQSLIGKSIPKFMCAIYNNPNTDAESHHNVVTYQVLSRAYNRLNKHKEAISACEEALKLEPNNSRVSSWLRQIKLWHIPPINEA